MLPIYRGLDGLDVSFRGHISDAFAAELQLAKEWAQSNHTETCLRYAGVTMLVAERGTKGGYAFRASTGRTGATWFFKKPNSGDPWGVRVSCGSLMLAELGLGGARAELYRFIDKLGVRIQAQGESIGRVDYAIDFLIPEFDLRPENFVMHSNAVRADHPEQGDGAVHRKSGRVSSVTIGKMLGRQVIVYDKRAEVIAHKKWAWFEIWNAFFTHSGLPTLDFTNPAISKVWRVEIRAGKKHLKDKWNIRTWRDLDERFGDMMEDAISAIRYVEPSCDTNRSRWTDSQLWNVVRRELNEDLFEMRNFAPPDTIKRVHKAAHLELLARQGMGLLLTRAEIAGVTVLELPEFALKDAERMAKEFASKVEHFDGKLRQSSDRYEAMS